MTEFLDVPGGRIAYDMTGDGPLVVLSHGMGDTRVGWRFVAPKLAAAGYRVLVPDVRGLGESSVGFPGYSHTATAGDLLALIRHVGGPAVVVGHSYSGGAATVAATQAPDLVRGIVYVDAFTRAQTVSMSGMLRNARYRKGMFLLLGAATLGSIGLLVRYLHHAYPVVRPPDWDQQIAGIRANLAEPGRMKVLQAMGKADLSVPGALLPKVSCPALVLAGSLDPDWNDPAAEAAGVAAAMPGGVAEVAVVAGAGHYPYVQYPDKVLGLLLPFLAEHARG